ncbi:MAG: MBL fold metallo-hydrolase [Novosphingobium sp.]
MTKRFNLFLLFMAVLLGTPYYWLLLDNRPDAAVAKPVTIAQLRELADAMPGNAPDRVELEIVAYRRLPGNLFVAGAGLKRKLVGIMAWQLPVAGGKALVIDSGLPEPAASELGMEAYDRQAQARINAAMDRAGMILITHEHLDHEGGLVALGRPEVLARARLNANQIEGNRWTEMLPWPQGARPQPSLAGTQPVAVAPGVVVIPAPSHTPGSQMIFVRLSDGREFLFAGDIATFAQSWRETRARSRLIGDWFAPEVRAEVFAWLKTIKAWQAQAPGLVIVPGHDFEFMSSSERPTGIVLGFSPPAD